MLNACIWVLMLTGLDQYTKSYARTRLQGKHLKYKFFSLSLVRNHGAFRGLLKSRPKLLISIQGLGVVALTLAFMEAMIHRREKLTIVALLLIVCGGLANLIDRFKDGYVTDFFAIKWTKNLYYNLADMYIFLGSFLYMIRSMIKR